MENLLKKFEEEASMHLAIIIIVSLIVGMLLGATIQMPDDREAIQCLQYSTNLEECKTIKYGN